MRQMVLVLTLIVLGYTASFAQERGVRDSAAASPVAPLQSYIVQLTEYRWKSSADPALKAKDIAQAVEELKKNGKLEMIETVRLSALESHESMAQFGKSVIVTTGFAQAQQGRVRSTQQRQIGTMVQLTTTPQQGKVLLKLTYEATRLSGEGTDDRPADSLITQFKTTLLVEPGTLTLVGGTTAESTSLLVVTISE